MDNARCRLCCRRETSGQMTIEFMAVLPVLIIVACIAVNALVFFADCAAFDIEAKNAIRTYAASPGFGEQDAAGGQIAAALDEAFADEVTAVSVTSREEGGGMVRFEATLDYAPNLFGLGLRESVFGVALPHLRHSAALVVVPYRPGMLL